MLKPQVYCPTKLWVPSHLLQNLLCCLGEFLLPTNRGLCLFSSWKKEQLAPAPSYSEPVSETLRTPALSSKIRNDLNFQLGIGFIGAGTMEFLWHFKVASSGFLYPRGSSLLMDHTGSTHWAPGITQNKSDWVVAILFEPTTSYRIWDVRVRSVCFLESWLGRYIRVQPELRPTW